MTPSFLVNLNIRCVLCQDSEQLDEEGSKRLDQQALKKTLKP